MGVSEFAVEHFKCTLYQMASLSSTQNHMSSHTGMWFSHKRTKMDIYTKLGNYLRSTVSGLNKSQSLYQAHDSNKNISDVVPKHAADRHHMGSGLAHLSISFHGRFVPWFQLQQGESLLQQVWGTQHSTCPWDTCWCLNLEPKVLSPCGCWWRLQRSGGSKPRLPPADTPFFTHKFGSVICTVPFIEHKAKVSIPPQHSVPLLVSLVCGCWPATGITEQRQECWPVQ